MLLSKTIISTPSNLNLYKTNRVPKKSIQKYDIIEEDDSMILDSEIEDQIERKESLLTEDKVCCTPEFKSIQSQESSESRVSRGSMFKEWPNPSWIELWEKLEISPEYYPQLYTIFIIENLRDDKIVCEVCRDYNHDDHNQIVLWDCWNAGVHQMWYRNEIENNVPTGDWFWQRCTHLLQTQPVSINPQDFACELCSELKGIIVLSPNFGWVHICCINWMPNVWFIENKAKFQIEGKIRRENFKAKWKYCIEDHDKKRGAKMKWDYNNCKTYFHVTWAIRLGLIDRWSEIEKYSKDLESPPVFWETHHEDAVSNFKAFDYIIGPKNSQNSEVVTKINKRRRKDQNKKASEVFDYCSAKVNYFDKHNKHYKDKKLVPNLRNAAIDFTFDPKETEIGNSIASYSSPISYKMPEVNCPTLQSFLDSNLSAVEDLSFSNRKSTLQKKTPDYKSNSKIKQKARGKTSNIKGKRYIKNKSASK